MHRVTFRIKTTDQWYSIMREARQAYGRNWHGQRKVKRGLDRNSWDDRPFDVWFEVPDPAFASWCAVKLAVEVVPTVYK